MLFSCHLAVVCRVVWSKEVQRGGQRQLDFLHLWLVAMHALMPGSCP